MAQVLKEFTFKEFGGGGSKEDLPWDEWFDGKIRKLTQGEDFEKKLVSLCGAARAQAKRRGLKVRLSVNRKDGTVVVQAHKEEAAAPAEKPKPTKGKGK